MTSVLFDLHDQDLQSLLKKTISRITDMTPVMKSFGEYMQGATDKRFRDEKAPDGSGWKALSSVTKARKAKLGKIDKILQQDGYLRLVHYKAGKAEMSLESDRKYARIHQYGGKAGRGRKVTIPKREFLGFSDDDIKEFQETCKDFIILGRK